MNTIQPWMVLNALNLERLNRAPAFNDMNEAAPWNDSNVLSGAHRLNDWNGWEGSP
jgi:hypothetical protein